MVSKFYTLVLLCLTLSVQSLLHAQNCSGVSLDDISNPGPYTFATINQNDGIRNGPDYGDATIYYPTNATPPFASVVIVPGFTQPQSSIAAWGPFLASNGIVTMTIDTASPLNFPEARADGLIDAVETLRQENSRTASPLFGNLDLDKFAVAGWSMGGGGAQLAAAKDNSLKAALAFCPWMNFPTSSDLNHPVPVLILSGENDGTAPVNQHANVHYDLTPSTTNKMLFEVAGGEHSVANDPANVQGEMGKYGLAWLRYYLLDDPCHCPLTLEPSTFTSQRLTNVTCPPTRIDFDLKVLLEGVYLNPGEMSTTLNTERGLLPGQTPASNIITPTPAGQPYDRAPWDYTGTEGTNWTDAEYSQDVVDWLLVSFRADIQKSSEIAMTAAPLLKDGTIQILDDFSLLPDVDSMYIVIEHRNHLGIMTPQAIEIANNMLTYDFTLTDSYTGNGTGLGQKQLSSGEWAMFAGDADQSDFPSYDILGSDKAPWEENNGLFDNYIAPDFNMDGDVNGADKSLWFENNGVSSRVPK